MQLVVLKKGRFNQNERLIENIVYAWDIKRHVIQPKRTLRNYNSLLFYLIMRPTLFRHCIYQNDNYLQVNTEDRFSKLCTLRRFKTREKAMSGMINLSAPNNYETIISHLVLSALQVWELLWYKGAVHAATRQWKIICNSKRWSLSANLKEFSVSERLMSDGSAFQSLIVCVK